MVELDTTNIQNNRISDVINCSTKKTQLNHFFSGFSTLLESVF